MKITLKTGTYTWYEKGYDGFIRHHSLRRCLHLPPPLPHWTRTDPWAPFSRLHHHRCRLHPEGEGKRKHGKLQKYYGANQG